MDVFFMPTSMFLFSFSRASSCMNSQVVRVDGEPSLGYLFTEYSVHHHLEGCWGVSESKEHNCQFEESFRGQECHFRFIAWFDTYVVVPPSNVKFCEEGTSTQSINCLGNKGGDITIPLGPLVYRLIVLDGLELSIFLLDEEEVGGVGTP